MGSADPGREVVKSGEHGLAPETSTSLAAVPAVIELTEVAKRYATARGTVTAVTGVSLGVAERSFVAIVGPSGCGKSTLLKMLAGLVTPTSGGIALYGETVSGPTPHVGIMFQKSVLFPWRTVLQNVLLPVDVRRLKRAAYIDRAHELLAQVGLADFTGHPPRELSGGMQQRVALCRALINDPPVLLLDEPFGALDSITREQLNDLLLDICVATAKTTVLVTHDVDEAVYLADQVVVMSPRPGRVVETVPIALPRPRDNAARKLPEFHAAGTHVRSLLGLAHRHVS